MAETVTLTFLDSVNADAPVPDLLVQVYNAAGTVFVTSGTTDTLGVVVFSLPIATYILRMYKAGVSSEDEEIEVISGGIEEDVEVSSIVVAPPSSPQLCRVYGDFMTMAGIPIEQFKIRVTNLYDPETSVFSVGETTNTFETDEDGHVEMDLVRGMRVRVSLVTTPITREFVVPSSPTANLLTLLGTATDAFAIVR